MNTVHRLQSFFQLLIIASTIIIPFFVYPVDGISDEVLLKSQHPKYHFASTTLTVLVVLIELPDDPHHPSNTVQHYEDLFFSNNENSISQYYRNTSYGEVILVGKILGWYKAKHNLSYYGEGSRLENVDIRPDYLANESRNRACVTGKDPQNYDFFVVIHSGDGQEYSGNSDDIWSHKFDLGRFGLNSIEYSMNHEFISYIAPSHELGHELNFPDLYDLSFNNIYAGPYGMMAYGEGHFSIWNKYYSRVSQPNSAQFLTEDNRLQVTNFTTDTITTVNPLAISEPEGIMWLELGWDSTGFSNPEYGRGSTITVRENLDYDRYLPKHGVVVAEIQVGPRSPGQIQVGSNTSPPWNVIDAHPETSENKDDAAFSLANGDIGTYCSGSGWAVQLIEKYENSSYSLRVTNESKIPQLEIIPPDQAIMGAYDIQIIITSSQLTAISTVEISIDNGPWQICNPSMDLESTYHFRWDTTGEREGTHLIRARAIDNAKVPYIGYSPFLTVDVDNTAGSILVVDDDLGRTSETTVLSALDALGYAGQYEILKTSSLTDAEITAEEMMNYKYIIWVGNPSIVPISNSHINYNEFKEIKKYFEISSEENPSSIIFMSNYNIFDFSNQGSYVAGEIEKIFRVRSPKNFRAPVILLRGSNFLKNLPSFTLGPTHSLRANRSSDGEVVTLLSGTMTILEDVDPEFPGYGTKGYYVDNGEYKLINFLFQPEIVPSSILPTLLNLSLNFLAQPNNSTFITYYMTHSHSISSTSGIDLFVFIGLLIVGIFTITLYIKKFKENG